MYICLFSLLTAKFAIDHQSIFLMREVSSGESSFKKHFVMQPSARDEIKCKVKTKESPKIPILFLFWFFCKAL